MHSSAPSHAAGPVVRHRLYSEAERQRRDGTVWTLVQGVLAPIQFLIFLVSLSLVIHYLVTGTWYQAATLSVVVKTLALYLIMITGAIWEKVVFGQYLFAPAFFWEDVFSFAVIFLHSLYLYGLFSGAFAPGPLMSVALAAYAAYVINAGQFLWKLRTARLEYARQTASAARPAAAAQVAA
jgi:3-vinyl bacteriochlorophyllide hydratase